MRPIKVIYYGFLALLYTTIALALLEAAFRIHGKYQVCGLVYDKDVIWRLNPNEYEDKIKDGKPYRISSNSKGFRDREHELQKTEGVKRIILLGDSYTAGLDLTDEEIFATIFEGNLNKKSQKYEVINASVPSWGIDQQFLYLTAEGFDYEPDYVVLIAAPNDIRETYGKKLITLSDAEDGISINSVHFPFKYRVGWYLAANSFFFQYLKKEHFTTKYGAVWDLYNFYPVHIGDMEQNWDLPVFLRQAPPEVLESKKLYEALLVKMAVECSKRGIKFMLTMLPTKMEFDSTLIDPMYEPGLVAAEIKDLCLLNRYSYLDLHAKLNGSAKSAMRIFLELDFHMNAAGHAFIAKHLTEFFKENE